MVGKLLIIEDDPTALRLIEYTLKQRGYQVITTRNGLEGIITAQKEEPDLIILDIMLPGIDGFEVCKRLRAGAQTAKIPILIISAKIQTEDINTGFRAGADDYLCKPASPSEIIARVENLIGKKSSGQSKLVIFINSGEIPGVTMILVNLAAALLEQGRQVTLVDIANGRRRRWGKEAGSSQNAPRIILETEPLHDAAAEPGYEVLPSGVRILHIDTANGSEDEVSTSNINLIQKVCQSNDYVIIDLPLIPTPFTTAVLKSSGLTIILSDYRLPNISEIQNIIKLFRFLGMKPEEIAAVLVDPAGEFPGLSLSNVKPYIEANLGITLAEVISYDAKMCQMFFLDSQPFVQSNPNQKFSQDIKHIAKYIIAFGYNQIEAPPERKAIPSLEKKH
jgi:CheY-like chemotaxis protein/MinD-like ATPase involved in chromosome partitioning or flagellar assembly